MIENEQLTRQPIKEYTSDQGYKIIPKTYSWLSKNGFTYIEHEVHYYKNGKVYSNIWHVEEGYEIPAFYDLEFIKDLKEAKQIKDNTIFIVEDERSVEALRDIGVISTVPNKKYDFSKDKSILEVFKDLNVVIIPNAGKYYRKTANYFGELLKDSKLPKSVKIIDLRRLIRRYSDLKEISLERFSIADYLKSVRGFLEFKSKDISYETIFKNDILGSLEGLEEYDQLTFNVLTGHDIDVKEVDYLWYPNLARGKETIISSAPGQGKTFTVLSLCSLITNGSKLPDPSGKGQEYNTKGNHKVVYLSTEDSYEDTIMPRFLACGGNPNNFLTVPEEMIPKSFSDPIIKKIINKFNPDLIVFDAYSSFIGSNVNTNQSNDVRGALQPLRDAVRDTNTAVIIIAHTNKNSRERNAQNRVQGSVDVTAFARSGLQVGRDPKDKNSIILAPFKNNNAELGESFKFSFVESNYKNIPRLEYTGISELRANDLLEVDSHNSKSSVSDEAIEIINYCLNEHGGYASKKEILELAKESDISTSSIEKAKKKLGLEHCFRTDPDSRKRMMFWHLPAVEVPKEPTIKQIDTFELVKGLSTRKDYYEFKTSNL